MMKTQNEGLRTEAIVDKKVEELGQTLFLDIDKFLLKALEDITRTHLDLAGIIFTTRKVEDNLS